MREHHISFNYGNPIFNCRNALVLTAVDLGCIASYCIQCGGARNYVGHYHIVVYVHVVGSCGLEHARVRFPVLTVVYIC